MCSTTRCDSMGDRETRTPVRSSRCRGNACPSRSPGGISRDRSGTIPGAYVKMDLSVAAPVAATPTTHHRKCRPLIQRCCNRSSMAAAKYDDPHRRPLVLGTRQCHDAKDAA